jgi:ParB family chromosome partitioning protein
MTTITDISLAKLIPCPANVRRTGAGSGIDALAASIQAHGLLQSLVVRPNLDGEGQASGRYEVVAGGRRLAALKLLAKQKWITRSTAIPCRVLESDGVDGAEASLAENVVRHDMHPADQFEAFHGLHQGGIGIEDIAARFGVSAHTVRQRLRLASVSPALIQAYRDEELTLDHLAAFAVTEDREGQERVFGQLQTWQRNPDTIRRLLTHALMPATDRKALFVGLDAYTAAGGTLQRDLFSEDRGGWITDTVLLERLVAERMEREAEVIRAEGWRWVGIGQEAQAAVWNLLSAAVRIRA